MPTALREKGYKFYFVMFDLYEPMHVHVDKQDKTAKFWLSPVRVARNHGYRTHELREIEAIIESRLQQLMARWQEEKEKLV
ncbi:MAG: DUF4160 domain-containing protein [Caldilineaceae bacterium]